MPLYDTEAEQELHDACMEQWRKDDQVFYDSFIIDPLPVVKRLVPVVCNPRPVTVLHGGVLFALVQTEDGGLLACEWLAENVVAPNTIELDREVKR